MSRLFYGFYRCRMCGEEFSAFSCVEYESLEYAQPMDYFYDESKKITAHRHKDDSVGYADFIGLKLKTETPLTQ